MLTVLYGTSCVGKTTLIRHLRDYYQWIPIPCYLTRSLRESDICRVSITQKIFNKRDREGYFFCVNHQFGTYYGTPKQEIVGAIKDLDNNYVLDFMIKNREQFECLEHRKILMIPETEELLRSRIISANRQDREREILADFRQNYNSDKVSFYMNKGFEVFTLTGDCIEENLQKFLIFLNQRSK
jgi:guanylate kinase